MTVRLVDVAAAAGVSQATASRALHRDRRPVSPDTRRRVLDAACRLGYQRPRRAWYRDNSRSPDGYVVIRLSDLLNVDDAEAVAIRYNTTRGGGSDWIVCAVYPVPADVT